MTAANGDTYSGVFQLTKMERVCYGPNAVDSLGEEVDAFGGTKVLIIASNTLATKTNVVDRIQGALSGKSVAVVHNVSQHNHRESVLEVAETARTAGVDFLVSLGGGSPIDCAKGVAMCLADNLSTPEDLDNYRYEFEYPDKLTVRELKNKDAPKHITISTTLSAGEFNGFLGITDTKRQVKEVYGDPVLTPVVSYLDPTVTVHTPEWLWASTGIRAVDHCVESYLATNRMPFVDGLTRAALQTLVQDLPSSAQDREDIGARGRCQLAAWMSIFGLPNVSLGLSHGIGHQLGARRDVPHGVTSCIMLPHVMDFNFPVSQARQAHLAEAFDIDTREMSEEAAARAFITALRTFIADLGVPTCLSEVRVTKEDFPGIVQDAIVDFVVATNPRPVDEQSIYQLLEAAY